MIAIHIDPRPFARMQATLDRAAAKIPQAIARGLNEGGDRVRTQVQRQLMRQAQPRLYASILSRVYTLRAYGENDAKSGVGPSAPASLSYSIVVRGGGMKIREFPIRVVKGPGGGVIARLWGVERQFKRSFQIAGRSGLSGLHMRLGGPREPIRSFDGPDLAKELMKEESAEVFYAAAAEFAPGMIIKRLSYLLKVAA